jgi:hypothetical protein
MQPGTEMLHIREGVQVPSDKISRADVQAVRRPVDADDLIQRYLIGRRILAVGCACRGIQRRQALSARRLQGRPEVFEFVSHS